MGVLINCILGGLTLLIVDHPVDWLQFAFFAAAGVMTTFAARGASLAAIRYVSPAHQAAILRLTSPLFAAISGWFVLRKEVRPLQALGEWRASSGWAALLLQPGRDESIRVGMDAAPDGDGGRGDQDYPTTGGSAWFGFRTGGGRALRLRVCRAEDQAHSAHCDNARSRGFHQVIRRIDAHHGGKSRVPATILATHDVQFPSHPLVVHRRGIASAGGCWRSSRPRQLAAWVIESASGTRSAGPCCVGASLDPHEGLRADGSGDVEAPADLHSEKAGG